MILQKKRTNTDTDAAKRQTIALFVHTEPVAAVADAFPFNLQGFPIRE